MSDSLSLCSKIQAFQGRTDDLVRIVPNPNASAFDVPGGIAVRDAVVSTNHATQLSRYGDAMRTEILQPGSLIWREGLTILLRCSGPLLGLPPPEVRCQIRLTGSYELIHSRPCLLQLMAACLGVRWHPAPHVHRELPHHVRCRQLLLIPSTHRLKRLKDALTFSELRC